MYDNDFITELVVLGDSLSNFCKFYGTTTLLKAGKDRIIDYCKNFLIHTCLLLQEENEKLKKYIEKNFELKITNELELDYENNESVYINLDENSNEFGRAYFSLCS